MIPVLGLFESHLTVGNLERSMAFYGGVLKLELAHAQSAAGTVHEFHRRKSRWRDPAESLPLPQHAISRTLGVTERTCLRRRIVRKTYGSPLRPRPASKDR